MFNQQRLRPACAYAQSDQSPCLSLEYSFTVKLLTEHHLEVLSLKEGYTDSSESTHVKVPHCWKSHVKVCGRWKRGRNGLDQKGLILHVDGLLANNLHEMSNLYILTLISTH